MPRTLGSPLPLAAAAALRLTPFFLGPSVGGPIETDWAAGVPAGGELGVESDALSMVELGAAAGESLTTGVSSLTKSGSTMARSFWGVTLSVMIWLVLGEAAAVTEEAVVVLLDLRRSLAAAAPFLPDGAIAASMRWVGCGRCCWCVGVLVCWGVGVLVVVGCVGMLGVLVLVRWCGVCVVGGREMGGGQGLNSAWRE